MKKIFLFFTQISGICISLLFSCTKKGAGVLLLSPCLPANAGNPIIGRMSLNQDTFFRFLVKLWVSDNMFSAKMA